MMERTLEQLSPEHPMFFTPFEIKTLKLYYKTEKGSL